MGQLDVHYSPRQKGETDDHCYVWIPERGYLFTGDLIIWRAPNCGNPQKVQRYPLEWADALEKMAGLGAEWMFPGHGSWSRGAMQSGWCSPIPRRICAASSIKCLRA
jgi:glyoxylase-like metal-dependent hydrolase (beta-lactamase superfamily II)